MIEVNNVSFSYSGQTKGSLHSFNLSVAKGECVLFCGRSGCGKTTVTRLINGLIPYFYQGDLEGSVTIEGKDLFQVPMYEISDKVGSVFQNPRTQFFNVDTDSEIAFGIENKGIPRNELKSRVEGAIDELKLQKLRNRSIFELSGGEKQQIAFASVHAMYPDIYLLDEPSSNLDIHAIERLKENLRLVKEQGKTILIAEHRMHYLMDIADRIIYLEQGKIAGMYTPRQLREIPEEQRISMGLRALDLVPVPGRCEESDAAKLDEPPLRLNNITIKYKKRTIIENISMDFNHGEIIGIVGENGAGKTTFSRALCGLHREYDGSFLWKGKPQKDKQRCQKSYMVLQDVNYQLFAESVKEECSFGIRGVDSEAILGILARMSLSDYVNQHPNTLSGGQKQRLAVAVSMICEREILIFDEPTSGLDFDSMVQVVGLVQELAAMGKIIFIVTHDYEFITHTCTRVVRFGQEKILADFPVSQVHTRKGV